MAGPSSRTTVRSTGFLLDFFLDQIGPTIYNRAVGDAQALMQDKLIDIDGELFEASDSGVRRG